jgi:lysozyme
MDDKEFLDQLTRHEGFRRSAYQDSKGYWTIGIGRMIDKRLNGGLTEEEAQYLLLNDLDRCASDLDAKLPWWKSLSDNRRYVLLNMCFNLGITKLLGFKNTLAMVQRGDYKGAAKGMLNSLWAKQVGDRAKELAKQMEQG